MESYREQIEPTAAVRVVVPIREEVPRETPEEGCLHALFEAQADRCPDAPALVGEGLSLSYLELDERANRLAHYLHARGAGPGRFVALYVERSAHPIVAILACLKAGAAYVPIDPVYPLDRIRHILGETEPVLLLTEELLSSRAEELYEGPVVVLDIPDEAIERQPAWRLTPEETGVTPADLAYVIYTSGTTGRPKGVMAEHRNAYRFVLAFNEVCGMTPRDRIYQGFSLGFDGSVEEIWMAFSNGATLVVGDRTTPRFGDDLARFLDRARITYFSTVPTLLSTITGDISSIRCLVVSGEACPPELVSRWARMDRELWNVYGPTEATVNTTAALCRPDRPVTIGRPLRGYDLRIFDDAGRPVAKGEKGELFVAGKTLARGYLRQPQLTAEKFIEREERLYRTGDLVRLNDDGELEFFGRIDSQVKIRGFRVELSEIESVLREQELLRSACVKLVDRDGVPALAAYVVLKDPTAPLDRAALLARLEERLPDYMVPGFLDVLDEMPMLTSGKTDRSRLPSPVAPLLRTTEDFIAPTTPLETQIAGVWAIVLGVPRVSIDDDFFLDLNGHSLLAAQTATRLRAATGRDAALRDIYKHPTVRKLAAHLEGAESAVAATVRSAREVFAEMSGVVRSAVAGLQLVSLYFTYGLVTVPATAVLLLSIAVWHGRVPLGTAVAWGLVVALGSWPAMLAVGIAAKWLLIGRYREGEYPVGGTYYFRWWLATRLQRMSGAAALAGTPLLPVYFRWMGAKVGRDCALDTTQVGSWDLTTIGNGTSLGADTQLLGYRVEDGRLKIGRVTIGDRCFVGIHSALGLNVAMGDDSRLDDQSLLPDGTRLEAGEQRRGSPAVAAAVPVPTLSLPERRRPVLFGAIHLALIYAMGFLFLLPAVPLAALSYAGWRFGGLPGLGGALALSVPGGVLVYALFLAAVKRLVLGRAEPGIYPLESASYVRKWLADGLMVAARQTLLPVFTTIYLPPWLRLMGARIGARAELSTVWNCSPELLEIGEESFFADGCIIGGRRTFGGSFQIAVNRIGRRSFVGNSAILPLGAELGDHCLLGVVSAPPGGVDARVADGTEWLGSPAFSLPNRPKVGHFDDRVIFRPTRTLYVQRLVIDAFRILIPGFIALAGFVASVLALNAVFRDYGAAVALLVSPILAMGLGLAATLVVIALKWAVMGRFRPVIVPLWSMYVWLNEMVNGAYESVMAPAIAPLLGTPFAAPFLRLLGIKVGRHVYLETTLFSEFDLVEIGDHAALNAGAILQTHLFEDRVMKSSSLKIGAEASVGNMAVVLYDTEVGERNVIGPLSLLMKGERLAPGGRWHGIPTVRAR